MKNIFYLCLLFLTGCLTIKKGITPDKSYILSIESLTKSISIMPYRFLINEDSIFVMSSYPVDRHLNIAYELDTAYVFDKNYVDSLHYYMRQIDLLDNELFYQVKGTTPNTLLTLRYLKGGKLHVKKITNYVPREIAGLFLKLHQITKHDEFDFWVNNIYDK